MFQATIRWSWGVILILAGATSAPASTQGAIGLPRYPSISPDGAQIVFSWRGDLWKVPAGGGHAQRLTSNPGNETRSAWSPDGTTIAFNSDRSGFNTIHAMNADGSEIRLVADVDRSLTISGFSPDGADVLASASMEGDAYRSDRPYRVSINGGPVRRLLDAFGFLPQIAPGDSGDIVFVRGDTSWWWRRHYVGPDSRDLWIYHPADTSFRQLTTRRGNDSHPKFNSPTSILYLSDADSDTVNLWTMDLAQGESSARRLTDFNGVDIHEFDVSRDGRTVVLHAWDTLYTLDLSKPGASPVALTITAPDDDANNFVIQDVSREVSEAALSPDGKVMATIAEGDIYIRHIDEGQPTRRITDTAARERDLAWSPDGVWLYYSADPRGIDSLYRVGVDKTRSELKDAALAVLKPKPVEPEPAQEPAPPDAPPPTEPGAEDGAPDAELPIAPPEPKADEPANGDDDDKKDDKKKKDDEPKKPTPGERWHDAMKFTVETVVESEFNDRFPTPSPDGKTLAFRRTRGDIMLLDLESRTVSTFLESWDPFGSWTWSPDSKHIAFTNQDIDYNADIFIRPVDGSTSAVNISRHPNNDVSPRFSADGKVLTFLSQRDGDDMDLYMVYLEKDLEALTPLELKKYYDDAAEAAKKRKPLEAPKTKDDESAKADGGEDEAKTDDKEEEKKAEELLAWDLDDAWLRLRQVTNYPGDESNLQITAAGDRYIFSAEGGPGESDPALFSIKWDGKDLTRLTGRADVQHLTLDGSKAVIVQQNRAGTVGTGSGAKVEFADLSYSARIDLEARMAQMFQEAARELGTKFYHNTMKGLDWDALTQQYLALARQARTGEEFAYVTTRLLGELNASHLGVTPASDPNPNALPVGRLGINTTPEAGGYRVLSVVPLGPADTGDMALKPGDLITAINFQSLAGGTTIEQPLRGQVGKEIVVSITRANPTAGGPDLTLDLLLTPISYQREVGLRYEAWRNRNAELVSQWSNGDLGYIHIRGMDQGSLDQFERDLYAAAAGRKGLIIDVRNNGGGWTADRLLSSIMVQPHAYTTARGDTSGNTSGYPQDRLFIQRYSQPITMLCNEKSFSNAEITAHAFKTLKRGTLVGQQTYGGVISTGGFSLVDGTFVRLPFRGWFLVDGTDMENNGAMPDLVVPQTPGDEAAEQPWGYDRQLKSAVDELLGRTGP